MFMEIRKEFRVTERFIYFNHASTGVIPESSVEVMKKVMEDYSRTGYPGKNYQDEILIDCREDISELLNCRAENIAFTLDTSHGIYIALLNVPLSPGDEVLVMEECFPAAKFIAERNFPGVNVRYVPFSGKEPVNAVKDFMREEVRAVVLDQVQYFTGERTELEELSGYLKENNTFLVVDGIQAVGSVEVNVKKENIDILACGGPKWLNGPQGIGFIYVSDDVLSELRGVHTGWLGAHWENYTSFDKLPESYEDARRFELGTRNIVDIAGLSESIKIINEFKIKNIEEKIKELNRFLSEGLKSKGYNILTPENRNAGILTAVPDNESSEDIYHQLEEKNIILSLRNDALRFSPHFYNTREEVEKILEVI